MKCLHPYFDKKSGQSFNCGRCVGCRANKASQWKLRCIYELDDWNHAIFLTLTYSDEWLQSSGQVPGNCTLRKKDIQDFVKRLRSSLNYDFPDRKIKFFICGEYSPKKPSRNGSVMCPNGERPHYHGIIFGLDRFNEYDRQLIIDSWCPANARRCEPWQFDIHRGSKDGIQNVTSADIGYVTDYASKKLYGEYAKKDYANRGREVPFHVNSQGLGLNFALKNAERLKQHNYSMLMGQKIGLPKYLRDKLESPIKTLEHCSRVAELAEWQAFCRKMFEEKTGLKPTVNNLSEYTRLFEMWYDNHRFEYADIIFRNFQQREKIRGNEV